MFNLPEVNAFKDNWNITYLAKFHAAQEGEDGYNIIINEFSRFIARNHDYILPEILIIFLHKLNELFGIDEIHLQKTIAAQKELQKPKEEKEQQTEINENKFTRAIRFISERYIGIYVNSLTNAIMYLDTEGIVRKLDIETLFTRFAFAGISIAPKQIFNYFYSKDYVRQENPILNMLNETNYNPTNDPDYISEVFEFLKFPFIDDLGFNVHEFYRTMFEKFLVRCIDNVINDDSLPNKQTLIVQGKSNSRKTSLLRWMYRPFKEYTTESVILNSKEVRTKRAMSSNMFILNDEFARMTPKELREYKIISTEDFVKYKPYQGYSEKTLKRRANFISSTEKDKFLTDRGGSVRFIIIELAHTITNPISADLLDNTDLSFSMWSQAYTLWKDEQSGFYDSQLTGEELIKLEILNKRYYTYKNLDDAVTHLYPKADDDNNSVYMNATELLNHMHSNSNFPKHLLSGKSNVAVGKIFSINHYPQKSVRIKKNSIKKYKVRIDK